MKVVYDPQIFSAQKYGGISRYFCEIATRIDNDPSIDISIFAPMHINAYVADVPRGIVSGFRAPSTDRFQRKRGLNYPSLMFRGLGYLVGDAMLYATNPDIIHETYFSRFRFGGRRARRVLTIYDMIHEKFPSSTPRAYEIARSKTLAARRADHVICISESTRRDAIDILGLNSEQTSVVHLGFDLMKSRRKDVEPQRLPIRESFLLYVGKRDGYKNFSKFLEAYATSPHIKKEYALVCFGGGVFSDQELTLIQKLGLAKGRVVQLGGNDQLLAELYFAASAFICPSLYEGFGIPPLEAMSYDCPVACSNTSSIPEVVGDAAEFFDPDDVESIGVALERVVSSDSHRAFLVEKGRERLKLFSWDRCATETLDIYNMLS